MDAFFNWLSANPGAATTIIAALVLVLVSLSIIYLVAFIQGREITFYPPKIGSRPNKSSDASKKTNVASKENNKSVDSSSAKDFFVEAIPNLEDKLRRAKSISINGITLSRTSDTLWSVFQARAEAGCSVRIAIVDPNHPALDLSATRFRKHQDPVKLRKEAEHALDNFEPVLQKTGDSGKFQVRLMPIAPAYGLWIIDAGTPTAEIWVELYSFRDLPEPTFKLTPEKDGEWFDFFEKQFELMWSASNLWKPQN